MNYSYSAPRTPGSLFGEEFYHQIDGVSMDSPLGPNLGDMFIGMLEDKAKEGLCCCARYVDDNIFIVHNKRSVDKLVDQLAQHNPHKFVSNLREGMQPQTDLPCCPPNMAFGWDNTTTSVL